MRSFCLTGWEGNHATPWVFALGLAASTWLAYTWQRHVKSTRIDGLRPEHAAWHARQTKKLAGLSLIVLPLALWPLWLSWQKWMGADATDWVPVLVLATAIFLTALYAGLPGDRGIRFALRRLPRMKLMWIGLVWALVTAAWPAWWLRGQSVGSTLSWGALMTERACIIMALTLPFDLRDRDWDPPSLRTIPQRWGPMGTRIAAIFLLIVACAAAHAAGNALRYCIGPVLMMPAVWCASKDRGPGYFLLLDGLLILDAVAVMCAP